VHPSHRTLRGLSMSLPQTLTRPMCRLWVSKSRHHRKSSPCWIQMSNAYHRTEIDTSTNIGRQYQDAEFLKPFSVSELAASQSVCLAWMLCTSDACNIYAAGLTAMSLHPASIGERGHNLIEKVQDTTISPDYSACMIRLKPP
jgi:hypothetical protein